MSSFAILQLPPELIVKILNFLDRDNFINCADVCKTLLSFVRTSKKKITFKVRPGTKIFPAKNLRLKLSVLQNNSHFVSSLISVPPKNVFSLKIGNGSYIRQAKKIYLGKLIHIEKLKVVTEFSDDDFVKMCTALKSLSFIETSLGAKSLIPLTNLTELTCPANTEREKYLDEIIKCDFKELKSIKINVNLNSLDLFSSLRRLELARRVGNFKLKMIHIVDVNRADNNQTLSYIYANRLTMKKCDRFTGLFLYKFKNLTALNIDSSKEFNGSNLKSLNLILLSLRDVNVKNSDIVHMKNLKYLSLSCAGITNIHFEKLKVLCLKGDKEFSGSSLRCLTSLTRLDLSRNYTISDEDLKVLTNIKNLNLTLNRNISDGGIKTLTNLTNLNVNYNNKITSEVLTNFKLIENFSARRAGRIVKISGENLYWHRFC